jgi:serine/threonine protein phosphatase PrpC
MYQSNNSKNSKSFIIKHHGSGSFHQSDTRASADGPIADLKSAFNKNTRSERLILAPNGSLTSKNPNTEKF